MEHTENENQTNIEALSINDLLAMKDERYTTKAGGYLEVIYRMLLNKLTNNIIIETKYTIHTIKKIPEKSSHELGRFVWEVKTKASAALSTDDEAKRSAIEGPETFPRYFYLSSSLLYEIQSFILFRDLEIISIVSPTKE